LCALGEQRFVCVDDSAVAQGQDRFHGLRRDGVAHCNGAEGMSALTRISAERGSA